MLDPAEPVTIGAMVGPEAFTEVRYLAHAKQMQALDLIPQIAAEFERGVRPRAPAASSAATAPTTPRPIVVALGSVLGHDRGRVDELRERGREDRRARHQVASGRSRSTRCARRSAHAPRVVVLEKALAVGIGGIVVADVRMALSGLPIARATTVIAGLGGRADHRRRRCARLFDDAVADRLEPLTLPRPGPRLVERELARTSETRRPGPHAENMLRDLGAVAARAGVRSRRCPTSRSSSTRPGTFAVGNRLLDPEQRSVQADADRTNSLTSGHRACQGCGEALGARYALDAAMRATGGQLIAANATGCLEVFSTPYPESSWQLPWIHSLFGNAPAVATGIAAALKVKGRDGRPRGRPGRRRRHGRHRLRAACRGCSSATTTCSTSATTTRPT